MGNFAGEASFPAGDVDSADEALNGCIKKAPITGLFRYESFQLAASLRIPMKSAYIPG